MNHKKKTMKQQTMKQQEETTLERIRRAAMKEFQEKDFLSASLRRIVKAAGVTTGAFYGWRERPTII